MLRSSVNCTVIDVAPSVLVETMLSTPAIVENSFSSGVATDDASVSWARAGDRRVDRDGRVVDAGEIADRELRVRENAKAKNPHHDERRHDGALDEEESAVKFMARWLRRRDLRRRPYRRSAS